MLLEAHGAFTAIVYAAAISHGYAAAAAAMPRHFMLSGCLERATAD